MSSPRYRDEVVDLVRRQSGKAELPIERFRLGIARSKFFGGCRRYGRVNEHNSLVPP